MNFIEIMTCIFIYNPVSGKGKIAAKKGYIIRELKEKFEKVDVYATKCAGDMTRVARESVGKYDAIIFSGGDGTFNELLQGIAPFDELPILGYIPTGTVNDVAHTLGIPIKLKKALKTIKNGVVRKIDCMQVDDCYAVYVVAAGAFTSATYSTPQMQKNHIGRIAYGLEGLKNNLKFQAFHVNCRGETENFETSECVLITIMNSKYVAGFKMNKFADLQDGKIEVAVVHRNQKAQTIIKRISAYFAIAGLFLFGYHAKLRNTTRLSGESFDVTADENVTWNLDGEKGKTGKIHIKVLPRKIKIIVPEK